MASLKVSQDELRTLDQARQRFQQLANSLHSLRTDIHSSGFLPNSASLIATEKIIFKDLQSIYDLLYQNSNLFQRLAIHPSTNYPGREQESILATLIRKKLEPEVEELVSAGLERSTTIASPDTTTATNDNRTSNGNGNIHAAAPPYIPSQNTIAAGREALISAASAAELRQMWGDIQSWLSQRLVKYVSEESQEIYTPDELALGEENVRTGLQRPLDYDSDEEEEDENGNPIPKPAKPAVKWVDPERVISFGVRLDQEMPANFDFERTRVKTKQPAGIPRRL